MNSDVVSTHSPDILGSDGSGAIKSAGSLLRKARESAGMHVSVLAATIKIPVSKLEALEADRLHEINDLVFTRALASSVCRTLRIDPEPVLAALPSSRVRDLHVDDHGINEPFSRYEEEPIYGAVKGRVSRPALILVAALLVGAVAMFVLPQSVLSGGEAGAISPASGVANTADSAPVVIPAPSAEHAPSGLGDQVVSTGSAVPMAAAVASSSATMGSVASQTTTGNEVLAKPSLVAPVSTPPTSGSLESTSGSGGVLSIQAGSQPVWISVLDARGATLFRRTLAGGERFDAPSATLPLSVVVGKADAAEVFVRGRSMDLSGLARENVARFEVK